MDGAVGMLQGHTCVPAISPVGEVTPEEGLDKTSAAKEEECVTCRHTPVAKTDVPAELRSGLRGTRVGVSPKRQVMFMGTIPEHALEGRSSDQRADTPADKASAAGVGGIGQGARGGGVELSNFPQELKGKVAGLAQAQAKHGEQLEYEYPGRGKTHRLQEQEQEAADCMLPPTFGAGYVLPLGTTPFDEATVPIRVVFKIDTGADPHCIVSRKLVEAAQLKTSKQRTVLTLADADYAVTSEEVVKFTMRVTISDRPRLFLMMAVVWEKGACHHDLLVSQTVALRTGLVIFVHDNQLREVILGRSSLHADPCFDPMGAPQAVVGSILGIDADEDLQERISPIDGLRAAMQPPPKETDDPLVNEELRGDLKEVFGPLCREPAKVPELELTVNVEEVQKKTYKNAHPMRLPAASPRQCDVLRAQFQELKDLGVMADAYPDYPPGPIASMAFTVPKPGVTRPERPRGYGLIHPLEESLKALHEAYTQSLTADRLVVNNVPLNEVLLIQNYPLPSVQSNLAKLSKFKVFAKVDITKAFWAIPLHPNSRKWTYTVAAGGLSGIWLRAPMGAAPVPSYFMWCLHGVLKECEDFTVLYADDVLIGAQDEAELKVNVRKVLKALLDANFRINAEKCSFTAQREITYLGWIIGNGQVKAAPEALDKLWRIRKPTEEARMKDDKAKRQVVRRFLGVLQYLSHYIPCGAEELRPLYELTKTADEGKGGGKDYKPPQATTKESKRTPAASSQRPFKWSAECDTAWDWAVDRMREMQPLNTPTYAEGSWLETVSDASKYGWGGILLEFRKDDPKPYLVACVAGTFTPAQINWPVCQKEMLGIWATIRKLRHFLYLHPFVVSMDHRNLLWGSMSTNEVVVRLSTDLQQHRFVMRHVDGPSNVLADYVSRAEHVSASEHARLRARARAATELAAAGRAQARADGAGITAAPSSRHRDGVIAAVGDCARDEGTVVQKEGGGDRYVSSTDTEFTKSFFGFTGTSTDDLGLESESKNEKSESKNEKSHGDSEAWFGVAAPVGTGAGRGLAEMPGLGLDPAPPRRARRRAEGAGLRHPLQPAPPELLGAGEDDGLEIPHMAPQPQPPPRQLTAERYHLIKEYHGGVLPHTGVVNLVAALREGGHNWPAMEQDCKAFVTRCHYCQLERLRRRGAEALPYRTVEIPSSLCECWHFDILGPLPPCALSGSKYILAAVEDTSKLIMAGHAIEMSTVEIMLHMIECFKVFGMPLTIKTDRGAQLISRAVKEFCQATGIKHEMGVAENHQSDAIVESGARMIWPYLRLMATELRKFHAWTPLLCNVQLSVNALHRESLGGACASEVMFGRRVRPMRFLRPEALRRVEEGAPAAGTLQVNTFIADQAALQLRILGRADAERHRRFQGNVEAFQRNIEDNEHLNWVRVGQLVSIPQPNHERFSRPNKWAVLRRGPYEIMEANGTTLMLRDRRAEVQGRQPRSFQWPSRWVFPYHVINEEALEEPLPPPPDDDAELPEMLMQGDPDLISAIVGAEPISDRQRWPAPATPDNVRNFRFWVRWAGKTHAQNSWQAYEQVWHTHAFQEFVSGWPEAVGHVRPSAYAQRHRNHVNALLRGRQPRQEEANVLLPDAEHVVAAMQGYLPLVAPTPQNREHILRSQAEGRASQQSQQQGSQLSELQQEQDGASEEETMADEVEAAGEVMTMYTDVAVGERPELVSTDSEDGIDSRRGEGMGSLVEGFRTLARSRDRTPPKDRKEKFLREVN